jgi:hypothetical protein
MATTRFKGTVKADAFEGPISGAITGDVTGAVTLPTYTVAGLPSAANNARKIVYVSNGNAGAATVAVSNGSAWLNLVTGTAVSAT